MNITINNLFIEDMSYTLHDTTHLLHQQQPSDNVDLTTPTDNDATAGLLSQSTLDDVHNTSLHDITDTLNNHINNVYVHSNTDAHIQPTHNDQINSSGINDSTFNFNEYASPDTDTDSHTAMSRLITVLRHTIKSQSDTITKQSIQLHELQYSNNKLTDELHQTNVKLQSQYAREFDHVELNAILQAELKSYHKLDCRPSIHDMVDQMNQCDAIETDGVDGDVSGLTAVESTIDTNIIPVISHYSEHNLTHIPQYCDSLQSALIMSAVAAEQLMNDNRQLQTELNNITDMYTQSNHQPISYQATIDQLQHKYNTLQQQNSVLLDSRASDATELTCTNHQLLQQCNQYMEHNNTLQQQLYEQTQHTDHTQVVDQCLLLQASDIESVLDQLNCGKQQINDQHNHINALQEQIITLSNKAVESIHKQQTLTQTINQSAEQNQQLSNELASLQEQHEKLCASHCSTQYALDNKNEQYLAATTQLSDIQQQLDHMTQTNHTHESRNIQLQNELTTQQQEYDLLHEQYELNKRQLTQLSDGQVATQQLSNPHNDTINLQSVRPPSNELYELQQQCIELTNQLADVVANQCSTESELHELRDRYQLSTQSIEQLTEQHTVLQNQLLTIQRQYNGLDTEYNNVKQQLANTNESNTMTTAQLIDTHNQSVESNKQQIIELTLHNSTLDNTVIQLNNDINQYKHQVLDHLQQYTALQARVELSDTQLAQSTNMITELQHELHTMNHEKLELNATNGLLQQQLMDKQQYIDELSTQHARVDTISDNDTAYQQQLVELQQKYNTLQSTHTESLHQTTQLSAQIIQQQAQLDDKVSTIQLMTQQLDQSNTDNHRLITQLTTIQQQLIQLQCESTELISQATVSQLIQRAVQQRDTDHQQHIDSITESHHQLQLKLNTINDKHSEIVNTMRIEYDKQLHTIQQKYTNKLNNNKRYSDIHSIDTPNLPIMSTDQHNTAHWYQLTQIQQNNIIQLTNDNQQLQQQITVLQQQLNNMNETTNITNHTIERLLTSNRQLQSYLSMPPLSEKKHASQIKLQSSNNKHNSKASKSMSPIALSFASPYVQNTVG